MIKQFRKCIRRLIILARSLSVVKWVMFIFEKLKISKKMQFILIMGDLGQENGCFIPYFAHCFQLFSFL